MIRGPAAAVLAGVLAACASVAVSNGDAARGRAVTEQWCVLCHDVGSNRDKATAPSFAEIARRPGRDTAYLRNFIDDDHFPMTMHRLFDQERDDVLAYLSSLREGAGPTPDAGSPGVPATSEAR